ncbi:L-rhamnose mutarotase [Flavihumibacter sp. CACIAM 22H1]|uniref:L-rhamnose mutarotase n=1 Tax=Flavihumibacter sp. CACIAM 22H1 TaxID=1812911 RepID=UPI0007A7C778|nr:L-rhamnose mutarotase [Flavihumibacter sp. CACIAM 22H1]KYP15205.1 MAG: hypothetical protein A1D16_03040 [Flavihumibacter sp. CACIAM 22H1]
MRYLLFCTIFCCLLSCNEQKEERHLFAVNISTEPDKLREYLDYHQKIWPEVEAGFKNAGYRSIKLYHYQHLVVMEVIVPAGADLGELGKKAAATHARCAAWNSLMDSYQLGIPGTDKGQKWVELSEFYRFQQP